MSFLGPKLSIRRPSVEAAPRSVPLANTLRTTRPTTWGVGISRLAPAVIDFAPPVDVWSREAAMSIPTVARCRDLICNTIASLPLTLWTLSFNQQAEPVERRLPPASWMVRPDRNKTRQYTLAWLADDLFFHARGYLRVTSRYATGFPQTFEWLPATDLNVGTDGTVRYLGQAIKPEDVIEFLSPTDGLLSIGWRAINIANNLDSAAERFSTVELPAGWLQQRENSEPLDATELADLASDFQAARNARVVAALNPYLEWHESQMDPDRLQLTEARGHQALELSRLSGVPPYMVGAPAGTSMTYQNATEARGALIDYGCMPYLQAIEQTLSGDNVLPQGQFCRLEVAAWLRSPFTTGTPGPNDAEIALNPSSQPEQQPELERGPGRPRDVDGLNARSTP